VDGGYISGITWTRNSDGGRDLEAERNAVLMAAAPDLYRAAVRALAFVRALELETKQWDAVVHRLEWAIAKAEC
jgi:hypothetical protein